MSSWTYVRRVAWSSILCGLVALFLSAGRGSTVLAQQPVYTPHGFNFSPYIDGQDPNFGSQISIEQIRARMQIIAGHTSWVRSFSSTHGLETIPVVAREFGLQVAAGAWIGSVLAQNEIEIANLIAAAQAGQVDIAIVGSEVLLRGDVSEAQLLDYIARVKAAIPAGIPVTTADTYDRLLAHPDVISASDVVLPNIYPFWQEIAFSNALCAATDAYQQIVAASNGKPVIISETGWASAGQSRGAAVPSPENASRYFLQFTSWARANQVKFFYFAALDESWKATHDEGPVGAHWGVWDKNGVLKPGMQAVFDGETDLIDCTGIPGGPGIPTLRFTYVPPYGSSDNLEGEELHVDPTTYKVVVYINVAGTWWVKPTFAQPLTPIQHDGSWITDITTGGVDETATQIAAFLVPDGYNPPLTPTGTLPAELLQNSVAHVQVSRTQNSISGVVVDSLGHPLSRIETGLGGTDNQITETAPDGKYSFYAISGSGPEIVTPSSSDYLFTPHDRSFPMVSGNQIANFTGTQTVDLSIAQDVSPRPLVIGSQARQTVVVANGGPGSSSDAVVTMTLPVSFTSVSATTSRGTCTSTAPFVCHVGSLNVSATATIIIEAIPTLAGPFTIGSSVSGSEPDLNPSNNTVDQQVIVENPVPHVTISAHDAAELGSAGTPVSGYFRVQRDMTSQPLTVGLASLDGSATKATDYTPVALTPVTIPAGVAFVDIPIVPIVDADIEGPETLVLTLAGSAAYTIDPPGSATATIADYVGGTLGALQNVSFGKIPNGSSVTKTLNLTNTSSTERLVVTITTPTTPFSLVSITGGTGSGTTRIIPPAPKRKGSANVVTVTLRFAPTQPRSTFTQAIAVRSTDPARPAGTITLSGSTR